MVHEDYKELLPAKALSAIDAADARALESHLEGCDECRAEMNAWEQTAALLSLDAEPQEPSPELRQRILNEARSERAASATRDPKVLTFERPARVAASPFRHLGAIAATLLVAALSIALLLLWQQNRRTQQALANLSTEMQQAKDELQRERSVLALVSSPDARMAMLAGTKDAPGAQAMLAYDKSGHAMLMAKGLPLAPSGMAYQLWFIKDNKKMPGKVFRTDASGKGILEDQVPAVARDAAVFAITLEPEGGVQVPTGSIYLVSAI